ncbi:MAG TPA: phosphatidylinositol mannoside acyltransferase [Actinomycetes bacterium]|nr:phosphatidylinositol mannoside acyltransferase [Actinomycetes bacterium]
MRAWLADTAYGAGWTVVRYLPDSMAKVGFQTIADVATHRGGGSLERLRANLSRVVPDASDSELDALTKAAMRSYLRYWNETFRLPRWAPDEVVRRMVVHSEDRIWEYRARGNGLIAVLGHFGNWDHCGAWAATVGLPLTTVAERLRPESLFDRFVAYRESLGMEVIPLTGGPNVADTLRRRLEADGFVCLLADRDLTASGIEVQLLGESARFPAGPALLAARTGATLMPTLSYYDRDRTHIEFLPEIVVPTSGSLRERVQQATQRWADIVGQAARDHPSDWHMLQRIWSDDLVNAR